MSANSENFGSYSHSAGVLQPWTDNTGGIHSLPFPLPAPFYKTFRRIKRRHIRECLVLSQTLCRPEVLLLLVEPAGRTGALSSVTRRQAHSGSHPFSPAASTVSSSSGPLSSNLTTSISRPSLGKLSVKHVLGAYEVVPLWNLILWSQ